MFQQISLKRESTAKENLLCLFPYGFAVQMIISRHKNIFGVSWKLQWLDLKQTLTLFTIMSWVNMSQPNPIHYQHIAHRSADGVKDAGYGGETRGPKEASKNLLYLHPHRLPGCPMCLLGCLNLESYSSSLWYITFPCVLDQKHGCILITLNL